MSGVCSISGLHTPSYVVNLESRSSNTACLGLYIFTITTKMVLFCIWLYECTTFLLDFRTVLTVFVFILHLWYIYWCFVLMFLKIYNPKHAVFEDRDSRFTTYEGVWRPDIEQTPDILANARYKIGPSWSWSYGSLIYNYLCNQYLSPLLLWGQISIRARCTILCDKGLYICAMVAILERMCVVLFLFFNYYLKHQQYPRSMVVL
jgi:hypothetical protein